MALEVPTLHKRLPQGVFASDLGQTGTSDDPANFFLISTLTSPLYLSTDSGFDQIEEVALFALNSPQITSINWKLIHNPNGTNIEVPLTAFKDQFICRLNINDLSTSGLLTIVATVALASKAVTCRIVQELRAKNPFYDSLSNEPIAYAGDKAASFKFTSCYCGYVHVAIFRNFLADRALKSEIPASYLASYIYSIVLLGLYHDEMVQLKASYAANDAIGVCQIPLTCARLVVSTGDEDIANILRFPKGNIAVCAALIRHLKTSVSEWNEIGASTFMDHAVAPILIANALAMSCRDSRSPLTVLTELRGIVQTSPDGSWKISHRFIEGQKIVANVGSPWCTSFVQGLKTIRGTVVNSVDSAPLTGIKISLFYHPCLIGDEVDHLTSREELQYGYRVRIVTDNLLTYDAINGATTGATPLRNFETLPLVQQLIDETGQNWFQVKTRKQGNRWVKVIGSPLPAIIEEVATVELLVELFTDANGRFEIVVPKAGLYLIRTTKPNGGYYDGESEWFTAPRPRGAPVVIKMEKGEENAKWVREASIVEKISKFVGWTYTPECTLTATGTSYKVDAHYPALLNFHTSGNFNSGNGKYLSDQTDDTPTQVNFSNHPPSPWKLTDCTTFAEAILATAWRDAPGPATTWNLYTEHNIWINNGPTATERLTVIQPALAKNMGKCIYAHEKNDVATDPDKDLNSVYDNRDATRLTPFSLFNYPKPWTLVQHYVNPTTSSNWQKGHMYVIIDFHRDETNNADLDKILYVEANDAELSPPYDGPQIHRLVHIDDIFEAGVLVAHPVQQKWWWDQAENKINNKNVGWKKLKDDNKGLILIRLYVYDLKLVPPHPPKFQ